MIDQCPHCHAEPKLVVGVEVQAVYDGVLYWAGSNCGWAWEREGFTGFRAEKATEFINQNNEGIR